MPLRCVPCNGQLNNKKKVYNKNSRFRQVKFSIPMRFQVL